MNDIQRSTAEAAKIVRAAIPGELPAAAVISGSGLNALFSRGTVLSQIDFREIPGMPVPAVPGHDGRLGVFELGEGRYLYLNGRAHLYEGYPAESLGFAVRLAAELGVKTIVPTCAVGSLRNEIAAGTLVAITDHINLSGANPLVGITPTNESMRFPSTGQLYTPELVEAAIVKADELGIDMAKGIYASVTGPSYETPAEARMLATLGADVVGMSLVSETLTAAQLGLRVLAIACVTNSALESEAPTSHQEVLIRAGEMAELLALLLKEMAPVLTG